MPDASTSGAAPIIRTTQSVHLPAVTAIYAHHVRHGLASFETEAPSVELMAERHRAIVEQGLPHVVAEIGGEVVGFAYAGPYRPRFAYRFTVEDSVYLAPESVGRGVGRLLLGEVVRRCERAGCRQMIAVIGDSANQASIGLHRAFGFRLVGTFEAVGFKHGRWVDTVLMQRPLGEGDASASPSDSDSG